MLRPDAPLNRTASSSASGSSSPTPAARRPVHAATRPSATSRATCTCFRRISSRCFRGACRSKLKADGENAARIRACRALDCGVDVFAKKFLLVPVYEDQHWSLAIICHPGELARRALARAEDVRSVAPWRIWWTLGSQRRLSWRSPTSSTRGRAHRVRLRLRGGG